MFGWTIVAWIIDAGCLAQVIYAIQYRMSTTPQAGWQGSLSMIGIAAGLVVTVLASVVLLLVSDARWSKIAALVVAGALPGGAAFLMLFMLMGAIGATIVGGRFN